MALKKGWTEIMINTDTAVPVKTLLVNSFPVARVCKCSSCSEVSVTSQLLPAGRIFHLSESDLHFASNWEYVALLPECASPPSSLH